MGFAAAVPALIGGAFAAKKVLDKVTSPSGAKPLPSPIPYDDPTAVAAQARDKMRRQALRAQGVASTQRSGVATTPYSAAPKSLLGS